MPENPTKPYQINIMNVSDNLFVHQGAMSCNAPTGPSLGQIGLLIVAHLLLSSWFDLVSLFNGISTFMGHLEPKPSSFNIKVILVEEQQWYYLTHCWGDKRFYDIPLKYSFKSECNSSTCVQSHLFCSPVNWGSRIYWLHLCRGVGLSTPNECYRYDTTQSDGKAPVLKIWGMLTISSLPLFLGPLWLGVVAPDRILSICQIELFDI